MFTYARINNKKYILGLVSDGGVHSHTSVTRLCDATQPRITKFFVHAFTDEVVT
jgi:bisphosphoglycerate-independent phosphoglycerate mutase (AlkP superfamily)